MTQFCIILNVREIDLQSRNDDCF